MEAALIAGKADAATANSKNTNRGQNEHHRIKRGSAP
jgi:hypothetical protein